MSSWWIEFLVESRCCGNGSFPPRLAPFKAKISNAEQLRVHTMLVIGGRDMEADAVSVRLHHGGPQGRSRRRRSWRIFWRASRSGGRKLVAQTVCLLCRRLAVGRARADWSLEIIRRRFAFRRFAGCQPAIQQTASLRYARGGCASVCQPGQALLHFQSSGA